MIHIAQNTSTLFDLRSSLRRLTKPFSKHYFTMRPSWLITLQGLAALSSIGTMLPQRVDGLAGTKNRYRPPNRPVGNHRDRNTDGNKPGSNRSESVEKNSRQSSMLARAFRIMYDQGGTIGVLNGCRDTLLDYDAQVLVEAAIQAGNTADGKKKFRSRGVSSGILNALLGCCCSFSEETDKNSSARANMAIQLMQAYDDYGQREHDEVALEPDLVSLCLAYVAISGINSGEKLGDAHNQSSIADEFLRRAEQFYHKEPSRTLQHDKAKSAIEKPKIDWKIFEEKYGIQVLQDAEEFIILSKPSGMVCYHGGGGNRKGNTNHGKGNSKNSKHIDIQRRRKKQIVKNEKDQSLEECLLAYGVPLSRLNQEGRGLVHRIDRGTSGCLVVAKTNRMHAFLLSQFFLRRAKKFYTALVCSSKEKLTKNRDGKISVPIDGRPSNSEFVLETSVGKHLSRIKVETQQGRRHQVRIHCSEGLNAPILLDPLYGGQSILSKLLGSNNSTTDEKKGDKGAHKLLNEARDDQKFCLHASSLTIEAIGIDVRAPLPEWWQEIEAALLVS